MINRYSLHKINNSQELSFSKTEYSKFKFGDDIIAEKFGKQLAINFIKDELSKNYKGKQLVIISSPYSFVPTATFYMKNYFLFELNNWLISNSYPVIQETKIHRSTSYTEDYGAMSAAERMKLIGKDDFYVDENFLNGKLVLFMDDIRITGSHERVILNMLSKFRIDIKFYLLYFAELVNELIPPSFENELNNAFVKSIFNLNEILSQGRFSINTRIIKYILIYNHDAFKIFIQDKNKEFQKLVYNMAIGNSYHRIDSYMTNFSFLQEIISSNNLKHLKNGN